MASNFKPEDISEDDLSLAMLLMTLNDDLEKQNDILAEQLEKSVDEVYMLFLKNGEISIVDKENRINHWNYIEMEFASDLQERAQAKAELMQDYIHLAK